MDLVERAKEITNISLSILYNTVPISHSILLQLQLPPPQEESMYQLEVFKR
jgi:hypothetical protein